MTQQNSTLPPSSVSPSKPAGPAACLAVAVLLAACSSGGGDDDSFVVRNSNTGAAATSPVAISGRYAAYLADEATTGPGGTDFNGDGDVIDSIATVIDVSAGTETLLNVAAQDVAWISSELYLVVSEALDDTDWNGDMDKTDIVLLHWSNGDMMPGYVDTLEGEGEKQIIAWNSILFYTSSTAGVGPMTSNLRWIGSGDPLVSTPVATNDAVGPLSPQILAIDEGLIFLGLDETIEGRDLNADADMTDTVVLALLNGTHSAEVLHSTGLALGADDGPFRAKSIGSNNWQVGFLVSETAQGATNFNDPGMFSMSWQPPQCAGDADADTLDNVLHYISFAAWFDDPVANPPRNTGIVGTEKIAIANSYIATISPEPEEGTCDLNGDGDTTDDIARWTQIVAGTGPILPLNSESNLHALFDAPGGTHGLAECDNRFVIVVSEADDDRDLNSDTFFTFNLVGWLSPSASAVPWDFTHGGGSTYVGASWVAEQRDRTRLDVALQEKVGLMSINTGNATDPGDNDILDSVPTFADFSSSPTRLNFPGVAIAVDMNNAGIIISSHYGFYRVDEVEDNRDWNDDGDKTDFLLWRTDLDQGTSNYMSVANSLTQPVIRVNVNESSPVGAVFLADESLNGPMGTDFDGDGDTADLVIRYFKF